MNDDVTYAGISRRVHERLDSMCANAPERVLLYRPAPFGLGAQITGRIYSVLLALAFERRAAFASESDPPYTQTFALDLSLPAGFGNEEGVIFDPRREQSDRVVIYDAANTVIDSSVLEDARERIGKIVEADEIGSDVLIGIVFRWLRLAEHVSQYCDSARERLGVSSKSLAVHFRRGDKRVESPYVPAAEFNQAIAAIYSTWKFESLFLASDSPDAALEITCPPGVRLIFDQSERRYNNANHRMLIEDSRLAEQETLSAIKNISLLSNCGGIVGQDNAHFATIASASIASQGWPSERICLLDGNLRANRSRAVAAFYKLKGKARGALRKMLPMFTAAARMQRKSGGQQ